MAILHRRCLLVLFLFALFLALTVKPASAQQIIAPNSLAATQGNVDDAFPFFSSGIRYQQVYNRTQFSALTGATLLTQIAFRPFADDPGPFTTTLDSVQIDLSTTSRSSTNLSATFASNIGANNTTVYSGRLTLSSLVTTLPNGTTAFDLVIHLKTPFLYDPTQGNLLMDVRNAQGPALPGFALDATGSATAGVRRVFSQEGDPGSATGTVDNGSINDAGVVTRFTFGRPISASAPEPGSLALLVSSTGLAGIFALVRRRRGLQPFRYPSEESMQNNTTLLRGLNTRWAAGLRLCLPLTAASAAALLTLLAPRAAVAQVAVPTQHYDNLRTGTNRSETKLTLSNVNVTTFGKLFTRTLDASVNGQVLYVPGLTINNAVHNVIFASTSNNNNGTDGNGSPSSVYAFDADSSTGANANPLWRHQLPKSARWTTCTPVIDTGTNTLYVLTKEMTGKTDIGPTKLHALDLLTGNERTGSPVTITATVIATGNGSVNQRYTFDDSHANCRPGLLLLNNTVYIAFAHNSDSFPYHGWILGYNYNGTGFTRTGVFCTTRNGGLAGIWMAGMGLTADSAGNIYCTVGNGTFNANAGGSSYGMCVIKLRTPQLIVTDWFAPFDERSTSNADLDLGSVGVIGIPRTNRLFTGATKAAVCFLLNSTNLGRFTPTAPDHVLQRFDKIGVQSVGQNPVVWDAGASKYIYIWTNNAEIGQFRYVTSLGLISPTQFNTTTTGATSGGSMTVSANGNTNGILWAVGRDHIAHAFDASDLSHAELWNSGQNAARDAIDTVGHFQFPTVANGKVYIPTGSGKILVYGLLP